MTKETLAALNESIEHWKRLATGTTKPGESIGMNHCSLCQIFAYNMYSLNDICIGCPVNAFTGKSGCHGTPYEAVAEFYNTQVMFSELSEDIRAMPEFQKLAQKELEFLQSLLPPNETTTV